MADRATALPGVDTKSLKVRPQLRRAEAHRAEEERPSSRLAADPESPGRVTGAAQGEGIARRGIRRLEDGREDPAATPGDGSELEGKPSVGQEGLGCERADIPFRCPAGEIRVTSPSNSFSQRWLRVRPECFSINTSSR